MCIDNSLLNPSVIPIIRDKSKIVEYRGWDKKRTLPKVYGKVSVKIWRRDRDGAVSPTENLISTHFPPHFFELIISSYPCCFKHFCHPLISTMAVVLKGYIDSL